MKQRHTTSAERSKRYRETHDDLRRTVYGTAASVRPSRMADVAQSASMSAPEPASECGRGVAQLKRRPGFYRAGPMPADYRPIETSQAQFRAAEPIEVTEQERTAPEPYWID